MSRFAAHITLLCPWVCSKNVSKELERVAALIGVHSEFELTCSQIQHFPETIYLAPDDPEPILQLMTTLFNAYPAYPPYGGQHDEIIPHLTIVQPKSNDLKQVFQQIQNSRQPPRPLVSHINHVSVMECDNHGNWVSCIDLPLKRLTQPSSAQSGRQFRISSTV